METGTLKELNVKPGDVVECVANELLEFVGDVCDIDAEGMARSRNSGFYNPEFDERYGRKFRIISRAAQPTPNPDLTAITTPFGLLDEATQEALRAHGGPYEWYAANGWQYVVINDFEEHMTYRQQPDTPVENVEVDAWLGDSGGVYVTRLHTGIPVRVTFNRINGVIDLASYKVEVR